MKRILLLLITFVLTGTMMARQLTPEQALALAMGKLNAAQPESAKARAAANNTASVMLTHTEKNGQNVPLLYVYNLAEGGIIIASADDRVSTLLGYTDNGNFADAQQNESFMAWLESCSMALSNIDSMPEQTRSASAQTRALTTAVRPLLGEIEWNQGAPYNLLTPMCEGRPNDNAPLETVHAPTGCVATALAQVMMYHQWPVTGTGSHTNANDSTQTVDFSQSTYQWSEMLPYYKGEVSEESKMAVAQLMRDLGCALDMRYAYKGSGATDAAPLSALTTYFGYDKSMRLVYRFEYSSEEWNSLLQTELNEQRPVPFGAVVTSGGGHEFVIDGYDINGLYHVNWGWGGKSNGYFDLNIMAPDDQGIGGFVGNYTIEQVMVIGVKPDVAGTSVAKPELVMTRHFLYEDKDNTWSFRIHNYGLGDFKGEMGVAIETPKGEVIKLTSVKFDEEPILFFSNRVFTFTEPEAPGLGYKLYPYYCDEIGGEMKRIPALYHGYCTLQTVEKDDAYDWDYNLKEAADVSIENVEVKHNYVGFAPQLNITLSNAIESEKEYNEYIEVDIYKQSDDKELLVCSGNGQAFVKPGESQEIVVRCTDVEKDFKNKIYEGEYKYYIRLGKGRARYIKKTDNFNMVVAPPSDITYADYRINKEEFLPGDELVAGMSYTNAGGYAVKSLAFVILSYINEELKILDAIELKNVDIEPDSNDYLKFKKVLKFEPGDYVGAFCEDGKKVVDSPVVRFTIADPTAIDKVVTTPANDRQTVIYDLQGRPVQQMRKGGLYIGKDKKIVVVE